jgi:hypothetical protein
MTPAVMAVAREQGGRVGQLPKQERENESVDPSFRVRECLSLACG